MLGVFWLSMSNQIEALDFSPPIPAYPSSRLIGLEIELDAPRAVLHTPVLPANWQCKPDASLSNGREFILESPVPLAEVYHSVEAFSRAVIAAKMHAGSRGGFHVHVGAADYTTAQAYQLVKLYSHFKEQIDLLCGKSRINNRHCSPFPAALSEDDLCTTFSLNTVATGRAAAKTARRTYAINLAMLRCADPLDRSIEFRQQSASKRFCNIYGWACFCAALVDLAQNRQAVIRFTSRPASWRTFISLCRRAERIHHADRLVEWVEWRRSYLHPEKFSADVVHKLAAYLMGSKPRGLYSIAQAVELNYAAAKALLELERHKGRAIEVTPGRWSASYDMQAKYDLEQIIAVWRGVESAPQLEAVPVSA